jgi:hypothetical protein
MSDQAAINAGKAAWLRIKDRDRATYDDYLLLGEALVVARTACMKKAGTNVPHGKGYNRAMRKWLDANGLTDTTSRMRTDLVQGCDRCDGGKA